MMTFSNYAIAKITNAIVRTGMAGQYRRVNGGWEEGGIA
jgi:hypothetical protein